MAKVALIEAKKSRTNFADYFGFEFDKYVLASDPALKKILKKDVDIDIDISQYDWVILVGSEPLKYFTKITSITEHTGRLVEDKFIPIINPAMLAFKPEAKAIWEESKNSVIKYISGELEKEAIPPSSYEGISDTARAKEFIREALEYPLPFIALDSETTALYPRDGYVLGLSLSYMPDYGAYILADCLDEECERLLQELFNKKTVIFHNAKFDMGFFKYHFGWEFPDFEDSMLLHYCIDEQPGTHGLKQLALRYTKYGNYEKEQEAWIAAYCKSHGILKSDFTYDLIPFEIIYKYAALDSVVTMLLFMKFKPAVDKNPKLKNVYERILIPGSRFLTDVQDNGVPFDKDRLIGAQKLMQDDIDEAVADLNKHSIIATFEAHQGKPFNPNSVMQLRVLLFDFLGLTPTGKKTDTGKHSTDAEVLGELAKVHEIPGLILNIRQKSKIKNTYLDKIIPQLDSDSRLRTGFNLHSTTSGRLSSSGKLNMQQLPRDNPIIKGCIKARPGYKIVSMDLTTAEMYGAAVLSGDEALMEVFRSGLDFHSSISKKVFGLPCSVDEVKTLYKDKRQAAKAVTFGILYGAAANNISEQITKETGKFFSKSEAQEVIDDYFEAFPKLRDWIESNKDDIATNGFTYSVFGRKRRLANVKSSDSAIRSHTVRSGLNFLVQSPSSDINLLGAIDMNGYIKASGMDASIFALVHDSILAEVREDYVDKYVEKLSYYIKLDRGMSIPGCPIGCDFEVAEDYSDGKFEEKYADLAAVQE
jgi:DNA polymerase I-like protein with 3'-5' exonuclease and polymerase domains